MILTRSRQHALRAMIELARGDSREFVLCRTIAQNCDIPTHYLGKVLQQLVVAGLLEAARGRMGGYRLAQPPAEISVRRIMMAIDGGKIEHECLLGFKTCSEDTACALHCQWRPVKDSLLDLLEGQTLTGL